MRWRRRARGAQVAPTPDPGFTVTPQWKELVSYREGDDEFVFNAGWGAKPPVVYVPDPSIWDGVVSPWLVGRGTKVTERLREQSGHRVEFTTVGYPEQR